ncbi:MAG TPA: PilZ domain-containing protein [Bryobacteraceae bacterium]|jgi:hypothetical protein|nr:PilZ domain-containing protein [Bryobacteraceae bacterium]
MRRDLRRCERRPHSISVRLSWQDALGGFKFAAARSIDISATGIRLEAPEGLAPRSYVLLQADAAGLAGSASVRHCIRCGGKFIVGLEFSTPLPQAHPALGNGTPGCGR